MKFNVNGFINKYKVRLVVKGYAQLFGINYRRTFGLVACLDIITLIIAVTGQLGWKIFHLDVKFSFLNGELKEEIFVDQPKGYELNVHDDKVYWLKKVLYVLKQAPRAWHKKIKTYLDQQGFIRGVDEAILYAKVGERSKQLILSLYVDDILGTRNNFQIVQSLL